jgi:hypothetical protein
VLVSRGLSNKQIAQELLQRLFAQIERIVSINHRPAVTAEVVTLARERLVDAPV